MENYLADELVKLDLEQEGSSEVADIQDIPRNDCFERTGLITYISDEGNYVLIDGMLYFDITACSVNLNLNDKVLYLCYKKSKDSLVVVRILENQGEHWGDFDLEVDENGYRVIEHVIIGEVQTRQDRYVIIKESDLKFSLDDVIATFVPIQGDLLELMCKVQYDEDNPMDISSNMVVEVLSFRPLRSKVISTVITSWNGEQGSCDKQIFFNKHCVVTGGEPHVGARAFVEAVESNQGSFSWRVIKMDITENAKTITESAPIIDDIEERSLATEAQNNIEVTYPLKFDNVNFHEKPQLTLAITNKKNIPEVIKPFCATLNIAKENTHRPTHTVHDGINMNVPASYVARYRVTIGTCNCLGSLLQMDLPKGHFTHIIVDEAGQAIEPEIMIPMTFVNKETGQIILAGDPMQLGPVVVSKYCLDFGMDISFLSRILETFPYQKDFAAFENGFNSKLVTQLTDNYRSLQEVLTLPSEMFYDSTLVAKFDRSTPFVPKILDVVSEIYEIVDNTKTGGIFVHGVKGNNAKAVDSPSWYNPEEASMVALTVCKLYKNNIQPDELGIITPYVAQIKHLRRLFDHMKLRRPKIATVEEFQGQERPLIIISTVRSTESLIAEDQKHSLGFVRSSKSY
ncbi:hypothetical protein B5X24_HaOG202177 [Helicoverpa armigera]|uniref:Uncharacterized protein n=1 Tax=Helicoverpa armigera TaxID=29058 RepID=A0A2W1C2R3_HELAM|nr:hypothetical protein B5X24_HaOG202177 [Helicoverpa armigera]